MNSPPLEAAFRTAGGRVVAALAGRFRDLDLAEEAFAEACVRAAERWQRGAPADPAAWLFRTAERAALDQLRRRAVRSRLLPDTPEPEPSPEEAMASDGAIIPEERLRLIFVCCHPAVAADARAALTLRLVCNLSTAEIARAFLLEETTLAQRLTRAKRKIAAAGVPFEVPGPLHWGERLDAVLSTLEVAYSKAHEDATGSGPHAGYSEEMLRLSRLLADLLPGEPEVHALSATICFAEARRPARSHPDGTMVPLSEQDPELWWRPLIEEGQSHLESALRGETCPRAVQAAIHGAWCRRASLAEQPPWPEVLALYDRLLRLRDDAVVRLNRLVAVAEVSGPAAALQELADLDGERMGRFLPYHALRADLLRRVGDVVGASRAYAAALALDPGEAEARWLERRRAELL